MRRDCCANFEITSGDNQIQTLENIQTTRLREIEGEVGDEMKGKTTCTIPPVVRVDM